MRISVNWLRELLPGLGEPPAELAHRLSMTAVPVEEVAPVGEGLEGVRVGRVLDARPHPNADRLTLCRVDVGDGRPVDVVCGAPNVVEGTAYPYVPPGERLPGGLEIETRTIRGEESRGMLCSEQELELGPDQAGIMALPADLEPGRPLAESLELPDACLVLDVTPNRVDLACHVGVARELASPGGPGPWPREVDGPAWEPEWREGESSASAAGVSVHVEAPDRCRRYLGAVVRGVEVGPSPAWLASRLRAVGARPVNNVVDATNYVLRELNQPLHAFDLAELGGGEVRVRAARAGERLRTLDGKVRTLDEAATVIADASEPVGLAGVMGGEESEVTAGTADVFLECAAFDPLATRHTARSTGLSTDASYRFERGVDERGLERALVRCVEIILATAGGRAEPEAVRAGRPRPERRRVGLRPSRLRQVLGIDPSPEETKGELRPLGFDPVEDGGKASRLVFRVPGWRNDVEREIDLVEEVARRHGYENFPSHRTAFRPTVVPDDPTLRRADRARAWLAGRGFLEARSLSLVSHEEVNPERSVEVVNPLSEDESCLRTDLVPVLLRRVEHNFSRGRRDVRLFEVGTVFARPDGGGGNEGGLDSRPREETRVAAVFTGSRRPDHWSGEREASDVWDAKGLAEEARERSSEGELRAGGDPPPDPGAVPLATGSWIGAERLWLTDAEGELVGAAGRVRPEAVDAPEWADPVWALEMRLESVPVDRHPEYEEVSPYPPVSRDLAFTVPRETPAAELEATVRGAAPDHLERLRLFDVYEGEEVGEGRRSLAWRFLFRAPDRTLRDEEVDEFVRRIARAVEDEHDARIRES